VEGRRFDDGWDPRWTAVNKNDYTNMALHYYHADRVRTTNGVLNITTDHSPTEFLSAEDEKGYVVMVKRSKPYSSGLVQGWHKFCFTGGIVEIRAKLPGNPYVGGLWPAMWLLGELARATYVGSTDWIWPWSFDKCDRDRQKEQAINACEPSPHYGLKPFEGRGAPEIDILEAMPGDETLGYGLRKPYYSASYQVAPGKQTDRPVEGKRPNKGQWYERGLAYGENATINAFFYGKELKHKKKGESYLADAISANRHIEPTHFDDFHTYRLEWHTGGESPGSDDDDDDDASAATRDDDPSTRRSRSQGLRWYLDGELVFEIEPEALEFTGGHLPDEPMHLILNTAVSSTWGFPVPCPQYCSCECYDCGDPKCACAIFPGFCDMLPAHFEVDYVRVYQRPDDESHKVGCSTDVRPTARYVEGHRDRYYDGFNDEKQPLRTVKTGGAPCDSDAQCGDGAGSLGRCHRGACECAEGVTGPDCKAFVGYDDINYETTWQLHFSHPFIPAPLVRIALALLVVLGALVGYRITSQQSARKASLMS